VEHQYIEEHDIISLYSMGKVPAHDRQEFEEHFVDCPRCLDKIELFENFRRGLKQVAAEDAGQAPARAASPGWLALLSGWPRVALAAAACVIVALPVLFLSQLSPMREVRAAGRPQIVVGRDGGIITEVEFPRAATPGVWATGPGAWPQLSCGTPVDLGCRSNRIANAAELKPQGAFAVLPALMHFDRRVIVIPAAKGQRDRWCLAHLQ
jgi:hypothetical protein